jgi:uncharacterized protein
MPDGEEICLDWFPQDYKELAPETPIVLLIPGVNSDSRASYCKSYAHMAYEQYGYRVAIFCRRGQSRMPFKVKPHFVTWCNYDDLDATINYLTETYVGAPLFLQGISMGACFLQRYCGNLAKEGKKIKAVALGCISSPFSLVKSIGKIHKFPLLDKSIASMMKQGFKEHLHEPLFLQMCKEKGINSKKVLASKSIDEYNRNYSVILGGYKDVEEYKESASSYKVVKHINLPTLSINTTNDPIIPVHAVPVEDIQKTERFVQVILNSGDHTEYLSGFKLERWVYSLMLEFFKISYADFHDKTSEMVIC